MFKWLLRRLDGVRHHSRRRREPPDFVTGRRAEDLAHRHLESIGFIVIARNWRTPGGEEVDLIALDGDRTVFVEVKARASTLHASPDRAIDAMKIRALRRAAAGWCRRREIPAERVRFDVITVVFTEPPRLEHIRDAWALRLSRGAGAIG